MWPFGVTTLEYLNKLKKHTVTVVVNVCKSCQKKLIKKIMYNNKDNLMKHRTETMCLRLVSMLSET